MFVGLLKRSAVYTIQNYPNHVISALGDKMFFRVQFCKHKAIKIMLLKGLKAKELSHVKNFDIC